MESDDDIGGTRSVHAKMAARIRQLEFALDDAMRRLGDVTEERNELKRQRLEPGGGSSKEPDAESCRSLRATGGAQVASLEASMVPPLIEAEQAAFRRDLPRLLDSHHGEWVAYYRGELFDSGPSMVDLYLKCLGRGIPADEFVVRHVDPGNLEEVAKIDFSLDV